MGKPRFAGVPVLSEWSGANSAACCRLSPAELDVLNYPLTTSEVITMSWLETITSAPWLAQHLQQDSDTDQIQRRGAERP
jgi:hypothetical protein